MIAISHVSGEGKMAEERRIEDQTLLVTRKMGPGPIINDSDIACDWRRKDG